MTPVRPGATIGMFGGGQLGRMTALAARELGYGVVVLDPHADCAARGVSDRVIVSPFDDPDGATQLARAVAVATYEIEKIAPAALAAAGAIVPLRPAPAILAMVQDRATQKAWLAQHDYPVGPWCAAADADQVAEAARTFGNCRLKSRRGGYDGRGQARLLTADASAATAAWNAIGAIPCVVERELELELEFSLLVARRPAGEIALHPAARNWHLDGILDVSVIPGEVPAAALATAAAHTRRLAEQLSLEGVLAVEWFLTRDGAVLVNELAPRPHNTFHATRSACVTSQFEQFVRAVCDLPLGSTEVVRPAALANLLGDLWLGREPPDLEAVLAMPGVELHLYGKSPTPLRKVGHLVACAASPAHALKRVREARARLARGAC